MDPLLLYKIDHWAWRHKIPLVSPLMQLLMQAVFGCRIKGSCKIDQGTLFAYKGMGVLVVSGAVIGRDCYINAGCKIIRKFPYKNVPVLGDNVFVGPGAVICGPIKIGDGAVIAPNAVVTKSVPEGAIVGGIPARIIGRSDDLDYDILNNEQYKEGWEDFLQFES
jgi:serine O-acetyltransferase